MVAPPGSRRGSSRRSFGASWCRSSRSAALQSIWARSSVCPQARSACCARRCTSVGTAPCSRRRRGGAARRRGSARSSAGRGGWWRPASRPSSSLPSMRRTPPPAPLRPAPRRGLPAPWAPLYPIQPRPSGAGVGGHRPSVGADAGRARRVCDGPLHLLLDRAQRRRRGGGGGAGGRGGPELWDAAPGLHVPAVARRRRAAHAAQRLAASHAGAQDRPPTTTTTSTHIHARPPAPAPALGGRATSQTRHGALGACERR